MEEFIEGINFQDVLCNKALDYSKKHGLSLDFDFRELNELVRTNTVWRSYALYRNHLLVQEIRKESKKPNQYQMSREEYMYFYDVAERQLEYLEYKADFKLKYISELDREEDKLDNIIGKIVGKMHSSQKFKATSTKTGETRLINYTENETKLEELKSWSE